MPTGGDQHWEFMRRWGHPTSILIRTFSLVGPQCGQNWTVKKPFMCNSTQLNSTFMVVASWSWCPDALFIICNWFYMLQRTNLNLLQRWLESMQEAIRVNIVISLYCWSLYLSITSFSKSPYIPKATLNSWWNYIYLTPTIFELQLHHLKACMQKKKGVMV